MRSDQYSSYDSQEEQDQVDPTYLGKVLSSNLPKSSTGLNIKKQQLEQPQEDEALLKPKLKVKKQQQVISNTSSLTNKNSSSNNKLSKRPLTAAYTFKLQTPIPKRKKNDPVSLFQATSQVWKKDKFLTNRANNKEGRKLDLEKRNKFNKIIQTVTQ